VAVSKEVQGMVEEAGEWVGRTGFLNARQR